MRFNSTPSVSGDASVDHTDPSTTLSKRMPSGQLAPAQWWPNCQLKTVNLVTDWQGKSKKIPSGHFTQALDPSTRYRFGPQGRHRCTFTSKLPSVDVLTSKFPGGHRLRIYWPSTSSHTPSAAVSAPRRSGSPSSTPIDVSRAASPAICAASATSVNSILCCALLFSSPIARISEIC